MTEMAQELTFPDDMGPLEITTSEGTLTFHGKHLGTVDNERDGRPRWAELELYKYMSTDPDEVIESRVLGNVKTFGRQMYLLHTMGHSVLYHKKNGCNKGVLVPVGDFAKRAEFPEYLEPCPECRPPDWSTMDNETVMELEVIRHLIYKCATAVDLLAELRRPGKKSCPGCGGVRGGQCVRCRGKGWVPGPPTLSAPGARLVEMVKFRDEDIRKAASTTRKL
jgi:hypothetical protein